MNQTDEQLFLTFCAERGVAPDVKAGCGSGGPIYVLPPSVVSISYFGLAIEPPEITVYFTDEGEWMGGTNWLWSEQLPWIAQKQSRRAERRRAFATEPEPTL